MAAPTSKNVKESKVELATRSWVAKPILSAELTEDLPLENVYVGVSKERKNISTIIQSISLILPGFAHLKRCSANRILLAPVNSRKSNEEVKESMENSNILTENELKILLTEKGFNLSLLEDNFQLIKVPAKPARTKAQAAQISKIWSVNFHPDSFLETIIDGSIFNEDQLQKIESCMIVAMKAAKLEAIGNKDCNGSAVIVDPKDGKILAVAASRIDQHPMWHAAMLVIDLVARLHGGGAWNLDDDIHHDLPTVLCKSDNRKEFLARTKHEIRLSDEDTTLVNLDFGENNLNFEKRAKIIKRKYEEETPLFYPKSLSSICCPRLDSLECTTIPRDRRNTKFTEVENFEDISNTDTLNMNNKCGPYLCTGYWVFMLKEPCPMCAMALLHSRISRIFYGINNQHAGVIGTNATLHTVPGLNHRYRVWSGILQQECQQISAEIERRSIN